MSTGGTEAALQRLQKAERFKAVDALRGLAAFAVCWYHLTGSAGPVSASLKSTGEYGWLGVDAFFVISGFVVPYSMLRGAYRLRGFGKFLAKRLIRVDPPYLTSIFAGLTLSYIVAQLPQSRAVFYVPPVPQLLAHIGYAIPFFPKLEWLNPVYWTLAIEFQYYLLIGLIFPLIASRNEWLAALASLVCVATGLLVPQRQFFPPFAGLFLLGVYVFRYQTGLATRATIIAAVPILLAACAFILGLPAALAGGFATLVILASRALKGFLPRPFMILGALSYPLYLMHWPVGITAVAASRRFLPPESELLMRFVGLGAALASAYVLHIAVERPAQKLAGRIRYPRERTGTPKVGRSSRDTISDQDPTDSSRFHP